MNKWAKDKSKTAVDAHDVGEDTDISTMMVLIHK